MDAHLRGAEPLAYEALRQHRQPRLVLARGAADEPEAGAVHDLGLAVEAARLGVAYPSGLARERVTAESGTPATAALAVEPVTGTRTVAIVPARNSPRGFGTVTSTLNTRLWVSAAGATARRR